MKNVLLVGHLLKTGGISKYVRDLLTAKTGYKIIHFNTARPEKSETKSSEVGYKAALNAGFIRFIRAICITLRHLIVFPLVLIFKQPAIVHITGVSFSGFWENAYYIITSKLLSRPVFLHYLGAFDVFYLSSGSLSKFLIRCTLKRIDRIALLSEKVKEIMSNFIPESRLSILPSSVRISDFLKEKKKFNISNNSCIRILFIGGGDPFRKGLRDIIKAIPLVVSKCKKVLFILTGGANVMKVRPECKSNNIDTYVKFYGWIKDDDKIKLYKSVDILLLPSYNEGLPYVIIEALAAGLPVVATTVGGIPEVIEDGVNGFLIEPRDYQALARRISVLARNKSMRHQMSKNNVEKALKNYSLEVVISKIESVYKEVG